MTTTTQTVNDWLGREVVLVAGCACCGKLRPLTLVSDPDGVHFDLCDDCNPEMEAL